MRRYARHIGLYVALGIAAVYFMPMRAVHGADLVEMLNGQSFQGQVVRETDQVITLAIKAGGGTLEMSLQTRDVHAITKENSPRRVINAKGIPSALLGNRSRGTTPVDQILGHHAEIYAKCSPAIVGITCKNARHEFLGTGVCVSPDGLILTLTSTVPSDATNIKVAFQGGTILDGQITESCAEVEATLIKVPLGKLPYLTVGEPAKTVIGDVAYTLANPDAVINKDGRPAFSVGIVSGIYDVAGSEEYSTYKGKVLETDASVNRGSDGGPVLDGDGRLLGVISLSFSDSRFMGTAIPIDVIKGKMKQFTLANSPRVPSESCPWLDATEKVFRAAAASVLKSILTLEVKHKDRGPAALSAEEKARDPRKAMGVERERFVKGTNAPTTAVAMSADGLLLTAYSNVSGTVEAMEVVLAPGARLPAKLVGFDETLDIACLKVELAGGQRLTPITLAKGKDLPPGTLLALIGRSEPAYDITLNTGIVSANDRLEGNALQADFITNYGNQGGPVITLDSSVVGIAAFLNAATSWNQNSGVSLVTKSDKILAVWQELVSGAKKTRKPPANLGVQFALGALDVTGARIERVLPGSAADEAGLKAGDVIVEFGGKAVSDVNELIHEIRKKSPGENVDLKVRKAGSTEPVSIKVVLKAQPRGGG